MFVLRRLALRIFGISTTHYKTLLQERIYLSFSLRELQSRDNCADQRRRFIWNDTIFTSISWCLFRLTENTITDNGKRCFLMTSGFKQPQATPQLLYIHFHRGKTRHLGNECLSSLSVVTIVKHVTSHLLCAATVLSSSAGDKNDCSLHSTSHLSIILPVNRRW